MTYHASADGRARNYGFFSVGSDTVGAAEPPHATPDVTVSDQSFGAAAPTFTGLTIQHGQHERSFIEYVDLDFNVGGDALQALYNNLVANPSSYLKLARQATLGASATQAVSLSGFQFSLDLVDHLIELDFGQVGLGGVARNGMSLANDWTALASGEGYSDLSLDPSGKDSFGSAPHGSFGRLLGDTNGKGTVDAADSNLLAVQLGQAGTDLAADLNGDGVVDATDKYLVGKSAGRKLGTNPFGG